MFERGDLLLVPFPFTDLSAVKRRPVLAVTTADNYGDFIAIPVTSRPQAEHGLPLAAADMLTGMLPAASWIRTNRIVTLNASLVVKIVGRISERTVAAAVERFCAYIGYPEPK
jgi:mRNA interferase MazF